MNLSLISILEKLDIVKQNQKGRMVAIMIPPKEGSLALKVGEKFSSNKVEEDKLPKHDLHITLALVDDNTPASKIVEVIKSLNLKPFEISVRGNSYFDPSDSSDGYYVLYGKVLPKKVSQVQKIILKKLQKSGIDAPDKWEKFGGYKPHVTLKYLTKKIKSSEAGPHFNFLCDKIYFIDKQKKHVIKLKQ